MSKKALLVIDVQNDFCPGGALAVSGGDEVVAPLNSMIQHAKENGWLVIMTRDWHPEKTKHFKEYGGTWPVHCVKNSQGALFHSELNTENVIIISKGRGSEDDGYSGFEGHTDCGETLLQVLKRHTVDTVYIGGLATDYCVKATALDAVRHFHTFVLLDACRAVNLKPSDESNAIAEMRNRGIFFTTVSLLLSRAQ